MFPTRFPCLIRRTCSFSEARNKPRRSRGRYRTLSELPSTGPAPLFAPTGREEGEVRCRGLSNRSRRSSRYHRTVPDRAEDRKGRSDQTPASPAPLCRWGDPERKARGEDRRRRNRSAEEAPGYLAEKNRIRNVESIEAEFLPIEIHQRTSLKGSRIRRFQIPGGACIVFGAGSAEGRVVAVSVQVDLHLSLSPPGLRIALGVRP